MLAFNVVKERYGWAVRMGEQMCTPYRSKDLAVREANCLAAALRQHGEFVEVIIEGSDAGEQPTPVRPDGGAGDALLKRMSDARRLP